MLHSVSSKFCHQLVIKAPKILALSSSFIPFGLQKKCLYELLMSLFSEAIEDGDLDFLQDKWLKVEVSDLNLIWYLSFSSDKLVICENCEKTDVTFAGGVNDLILIAGRKEDPDTLFFQRRLSIQGDTELGLEVKNLLDNIDFDNLPVLLQKMIIHFSTFVQQGLIEPTLATSDHSNKSTNKIQKG